MLVKILDNKLIYKGLNKIFGNTRIFQHILKWYLEQRECTQEQKVYKYMKKYGGITSLEMFTNFCICCPHSVIRNLRQKYNILDEWIEIEKQYKNKKGKNKKKSIRFKRWFLESERA